MTRPNLNEHSLEDLEKMEIRELYALTEHWAKAFEDHTFTAPEREKVRAATRIYIYRREALRKAAPDLLAACKDLLSAQEEQSAYYRGLEEGKKPNADTLSLALIKEVIAREKVYDAITATNEWRR